MAIYGYGSGKTYATPQAAFDALQAANESGGAAVPFTETNYVRGYGDAVHPAAAAGEPALRLVHSTSGRGVLPTREFPLVIDPNGVDHVVLEDTEGVGALIGGNAAGSVVASHVRVEVDVRSAASHGIIINPDRTGGQTAEDWTVTGQVDAALAAVVAGSARHLTVDGVLNAGAEGAIYNDGSAGTYGVFGGILHLANMVARAAGSIVDLFYDNLHIEAFHNSCESVGDVFDLHDDGSNWLGLTWANNIFSTDGKALTVDAPIHVAYGDGNCFDCGGDLADLDGTAIADLTAWKAATGQDNHSIEADPLFIDTTLQLSATSPCIQQGRSIPNAGIEGTERALTLDQGAYQITDPASVKASYSNGRLRLQVDGGAPVSGL